MNKAFTTACANCGIARADMASSLDYQIGSQVTHHGVSCKCCGGERYTVIAIGGSIWKGEIDKLHADYIVSLSKRENNISNEVLIASLTSCLRPLVLPYLNLVVTPVEEPSKTNDSFVYHIGMAFKRLWRR